MKKLLIGCGSVFGLFLLVGACVAAIGGGSGTDTTPVAQTGDPVDSTTKPAPAPAPKEDKTVTLEEYNKIKNGMSYKEVVKIIGFEGTENSQNELAGVKTVMYTWQNDDGSNMNAIFQNDKLTQKAQFGLK